LREFGLERRFGKKDPVHATAIPDWKPTTAQVATEAKPAPAPVPAPVVNQAVPTTVVPAQRNQTAQTTPAPQTRTQPGITSLIPSANAADVTPANRVQTPPPPVVQQNRISPAPVPVATNTAPKPVPKAAVKDDVVYGPEGIPIFGGAANDVGPKTESPLAALTLGAADVVLGIPEAIANTVAQNYYNLPFGKTYSWKEASEAAKDNPIVQAAGMLRSGKWFGVEKDPAYGKDPLSVITSLPALGVEGIAERFGLDKDAANLALQNALMLTPLVKRAANGSWQVQANLPKKQVKPVPTDEGIAQLKTEADAATAKVEAPRLEAPEPSVRVSPTGEAVLPEPKAPSDRSGIQLLAEDMRAKEAATRRLQEAETAKAAAAKAEAAKNKNARALETYSMITGLGPKITPSRVLSAGTDFSTTPPSENQNKPPLPITDWWDYGSDPTKQKPDPVTEAKKVAEQVTAPPEAPVAPRTSGFSNDDILTMGLSMMMAQPGQPGGAFSQLASNIGRSGLATLQGRREREKLAQEQAFKDLYGKYIQKQTDVMGQEPPEIRTIRAFQKDPGLLDTHREMYENRTSPAMLLKTYEDARTKAENGLNEAWLSKNPDFQTWLRNSGYGGAVISPNVLEKMNLYK
jgi:hypothetical protein